MDDLVKPADAQERYEEGPSQEYPEATVRSCTITFKPQAESAAAARQYFKVFSRDKADEFPASRLSSTQDIGDVGGCPVLLTLGSGEVVVDATCGPTLHSVRFEDQLPSVASREPDRQFPVRRLVETLSSGDGSDRAWSRG